MMSIFFKNRLFHAIIKQIKDYAGTKDKNLSEKCHGWFILKKEKKKRLSLENRFNATS